MEKHMFILLFFTGAAPLVLSVTHKYYLVQQGRNWSDARIYCQATYTDLAIIKSNDDLVRIQNEAQSQTFSSEAWIGLYTDFNSWQWSLGNDPVGNFRQWAWGKPKNNGGNQNCDAIAPSSWNDRDCPETFPFLCFDETQTGSNRYIYKTNAVRWTDGQAYCRQYYTDLASARDATENSVLAGLVSGRTWFGLFKPNPWKWIDQTNFSTISWMTGEPDNDWWDENCGYLDNNQAGDASCSDILPFFCYSAIYNQQTVRMKIQYNQDLNDPALNAAILEKIKQKLRDQTVGVPLCLFHPLNKFNNDKRQKGEVEVNLTHFYAIVIPKMN